MKVGIVMKISGRWNYGKALVLTVDRMKEFNTALLDFCERIEYTATTMLNKDIQFESLNEMLSFDNFKEKRLQKIELIGYIEHHRIFRITIKDTKSNLLHYYNTLECFYYFKNFNDETLFKTNVKQILNKATPSYWLVGKFSFWGATMVCSSAVTIISLMADNAPNFQMNLLFIKYIVTICSSLGIIWLLDNKIYYNIFPAVAFLWEEEVARYDKWQKFRSNFFWGVIVALIIGLFGTVIMDLIYKYIFR